MGKQVTIGSGIAAVTINVGEVTSWDMDYSRYLNRGPITTVDIDQIIREARAAYLRKEADTKARIAEVDQYLLRADEPFRSILSLHERGADLFDRMSQATLQAAYGRKFPLDETRGDCRACNKSQKDGVPAEFRCLTVRGIYEWLKRNEAIVAHRATVSVLEVGAL